MARASRPSFLREAGLLDELAFGFVDRSDGYRRVVGIDPYEHLHESARTSVSIGSPSPSARAKDNPTSGFCSHTSFESLRTPGTGGPQAENEPARLAGGRKFASDPCITGTLGA